MPPRAANKKNNAKRTERSAPRGLESRSFPSSDSKLEWLVFLLQENEAVETYHQASLYWYQELVEYYLVRRKKERNQEIMAQYQAGVSITELADQVGVSAQRVHQIIHGD